MQVSAEIRWFWKDALPARLREWFCDAEVHGCKAGGGKSRKDAYLRDFGQCELGIKRRGGRSGVEIKGQVSARWTEIASGPFHGTVELWSKWSTEGLSVPSGTAFAIEKQRWLRSFHMAGDTPEEIALDEDERPLDGHPVPASGCNVELTRIALPDHGNAIWWTLGFEAFGPVPAVEGLLKAVARLLAERGAPELPGGKQASYPGWLNGLHHSPASGTP